MKGRELRKLKLTVKNLTLISSPLLRIKRFIKLKLQFSLPAGKGKRVPPDVALGLFKEEEKWTL